jgi:hypothetical protein
MSAESAGGTPEADCNECEKVRLEKRLEAAENRDAFGRELEKLKAEQANALAKLDQEQANALTKLGAEHDNALDSADDTASTELQKGRWEGELALAKLFHEKLAEVAVGSIERARDSAKYIQTVAAWIATLYTALLALVFSVTDFPLPIRGVIPAVFLGLAVALAAGYLAFITTAKSIELYKGGTSLTEQQLNRTGYLVRWINSSVLDRRWAIRASVLSLAFGVAFIPAPFIAASRPASIPDAPAVPAIPGTIAPEVAGSATQFFKGQVKSYKAAATERNEAIKKAAETSTKTSNREAHLNKVMIWIALVCLLFVLILPLVYGHYKDTE